MRTEEYEEYQIGNEGFSLNVDIIDLMHIICENVQTNKHCLSQIFKNEI